MVRLVRIRDSVKGIERFTAEDAEKNEAAEDAEAHSRK
jgi:hypothetical protein